jgi:hypothetical protein
MAKQSAAEKAAARLKAGGNLPSSADFDAVFDRLHEVNDRMDGDRATHMGDMNGIYEEAAKALDMPKEIVAALYKQDRKERKAREKFAKADQKTRESFQKAADSYLSVDPASPLGQWAARMASASQATAAARTAEDEKTDGDEPKE